MMRKLLFLLIALSVTLMPMNAWAAGLTIGFGDTTTTSISFSSLSWGDPDEGCVPVEPPPTCRLITAEFDHDNDGIIDETNTFTYDESGNPIRAEYDSNNDGTVDVVGIDTYDANGNMLTEEIDFNNDGAIDQVKTCTYDDSGNMIQGEVDSNNDGAIDAVGIIPGIVVILPLSLSVVVAVAAPAFCRV